jgi:hypothetical protein
VNLRSARGAAQQDIGRIQRHAEPLGQRLPDR